MLANRRKFPKAKRPGEYWAFFTLPFKTKEGPGFVYCACDAYSEFGINIGVDKNKNPETVLKHIYLLTEDKDFIKPMFKGFTLVLSEHEELKDRINGIISTVKGKLLFDKEFNHKISLPLLRSLGEFLEKDMR